MKYSILIPYYNRAKEFKIAIDSYSYWYKNRSDYEMLIGVDVKNNEKMGLLNIVENNPNINFRLFDTGAPDCFVPGPAFNFLAQKADGEILVLTNPETVHLSNVLDSIPKDITGKYAVIACEAGYVDDFNQKYPDFKYNHYMWYQHSIHNNRMLHFCSAIKKDEYLAIGGFDEEYSKGIGYDDNDFLYKVITNNIKALAIDDAVVLHIEHDRSYNNSAEKVELNRALYERKWGIRLP